MIVIAIIGILAAIALPAYARYMARARYTEVISAVNGVKQQVELCIIDTAPAFTANAAIGAANCDTGSSGPGYNIRTATDYATKYVASISVTDGAITATSVATDGLAAPAAAGAAAAAGATYILKPYFTAVNTGAIDWKKDAASTCIAADLC